MNIVLIGYRGTGKTAVAEILARSLKMKRSGMDSEIVKKAGMSIPEIVEEYGWTKFRDMESELVQQLSELDDIIVDTGGGVIERPENITFLQSKALVFWLKASAEVIVERIQGDTERPALIAGKTFTEEVSEVLEQRIPKYSRAAHFEIDTDKITPEQTAAKIIEVWERGEKLKQFEIELPL